MEETISLQEIFQVIKKRFKLIVFITIAAALIAAVISFFVLTPVYESSTQFIVNQNQNQQEDNQIDSSTIKTNVELINTYNVIIKSKSILDDVAEELNLDRSLKSLNDQIDVSSEEDSQVVTVTVKDPDPAQATEIANTTVDIFQDKISDIMNVDNVSVLSEAETDVDPSPVEPRPKLNIAIAIVLGGMVGVGLSFLLEYLDTTLRTDEDVEQKLDVPVIGNISSIASEDIRPHRVSTNAANMNNGGKQRAKV